MRFSSMVERLVEDGQAPGAANPWEVHERALARRAAGEDVVLLSIGQEADERTPARVVDACVDSLRAGEHHYADVSGLLALRRAIARYHARLTGETVDADRVTVFAGAQNALFASAQLLLERGDEVVLIAPYYTTYPTTFGASGATLVRVETDAAAGYRLDAAAIERALTSATRAIVLNVPGNPVGAIPDAATVERIARLCVERDIWLVLDAVYLDLVEPDAVPLPHAVPGVEKVLVTVGSLSKSHRMSGWRIGWTVGPHALATHFANLSMCMHYGLSPFVMSAAAVAIEEALDGTLGTPGEVRRALTERRRIARTALADVAPARLIDGGHGMFLLLDVAPLGTHARRFALALLEERAVAVLPCDGFGPGGDRLVRVGLCVDGERLARACRAIAEQVAARAGRAPGAS